MIDIGEAEALKAKYIKTKSMLTSTKNSITPLREIEFEKTILFTEERQSRLSLWLSNSLGKNRNQKTALALTFDILDKITRAHFAFSKNSGSKK